MIGNALKLLGDEQFIAYGKYFPQIFVIVHH